MLPTLSVEGDMVFTSAYYKRGYGVKVGDVVAYTHPLDPSNGAMKRVTGMPGDFVNIGERGLFGEERMIQVRASFVRSRFQACEILIRVKGAGGPLLDAWR